MSERSLPAPARTSSPPPDKEQLVDAVERVLSRLREARPHLLGRLDRATTILTVHLSTSARTRPIKCRIRSGGRRVYLVASLSSRGAVYEVSPADWSCSCPDFHRHGPACKHSLGCFVLDTASRIASQTSEDGAQGDEDGDDDPEAPMPEREPSHTASCVTEGLKYAEVEAWLREQKWIVAKTRPDNPHGYALKRNASDPEMFDRAVAFIHEKGMSYRWWGSVYKQLVANRHCHWTMSGPGQAILINRKDLDQVRRDELRNRGGAGIQWRWLHGDVDEDRAALRREEAGQDELGGGA